MTELWKQSAGQLANAIAARRVSSREVVQAHLERISAVNPKLNAVVHVLRDEALAAADAADRAVASGEPLGPLHGVPVSIKCNIDLKGVASTWGVPALKEAVARQDSPLVERVRAAGAIPIASTNCPDLAMRVHTDSTLHGLTKNPWNASRTASGSSGGDAAAIASGMSPLGFGNDIGGSLRNPANACGIASIRPSAGRVPDASQPPFENRPIAWQMMAVQGPMARTISDVRLGLKVISGAHPLDPQAVDAPFSVAHSRRPRVAVVGAPPGGSCASSISHAVLAAADALSNAGYEVAQVTPPRYEEVVRVWGEFVMGDYASLWETMAPLMGEDGRYFFNGLFQMFKMPAKSADMSALLQTRDGLARDWSTFMNDYELVLTPTWTQLPFDIGFDVSSQDGVEKTVEMMRPVVPANLLGLPSACVPAARDLETGMPIGVLLTGRRFRDDQCLDAAEAVEGLRALQTPIDPVW
ncbi:amidase [Delftia tsuruhatensis]|uniref:amidase n=1 Tax=Delftia tsuruhatensis TaxID=180282 RepID=UPI001EEB9194|nr:amidase [Delftia tsuruhatensis]